MWFIIGVVYIKIHYSIVSIVNVYLGVVSDNQNICSYNNRVVF